MVRYRGGLTPLSEGSGIYDPQHSYPQNRQGIYHAPIRGDVDSMTPCIRGGVETMTPPIRGGVESTTPLPHLLVAPHGGNQ